MAVSAAKAFGLYLRTLRNRAGLSLQEVEDLARNTPGPISKNYLSRCENGQLGLALAKMTILCKIYGIPSDVVLERMELDLELEQIGGPDTEQMSYEQLTAEGLSAFERGDYWSGYASFRDAVSLASGDSEQRLVDEMNCGAAAMRIGKTRYSSHEFQRINNAGDLSDARHCLLLNRLANSFRYAGDYEEARRYSDLSIDKAKSIHDNVNLAFFHINRASIAIEECDPELAIEHATAAQTLSKTSDNQLAAANALNLLGNAYLLQNRLRAARKAFSYALIAAEHLSNQRLIGSIYLSLGKIEDKQGKHQEASDQWREAKRLAKRSENNLLAFQADLCLLRQAIDRDLPAQKRNAKKRLARLAPFLPQSIDELHTYEELLTL